MSSADFQVEVESVDATRARFAVTVPRDLVFFEGHFEGRPMLPGVAQLVALADQRAREVWPDLGPAKRIARVKFQAVVMPGDALELELERSDVGADTTVRYRLTRGGAPASTGGVVYALSSRA